MLKKINYLFSSIFATVFFITISAQASLLDEQKENATKRDSSVSLATVTVHDVLSGSSVFVETENELIKGKKLTLWGVSLFAGSEIFSEIIRTATGSSWSHVGLILTDESDTLYSFESTGSFEDILRGVLPQVQIHLWNDVVARYSGAIASRQFAFEEGYKPDSNAVVPMVSGLIGKPYETDLTSLIKALKRDNSVEAPQSIFCSELTAKCLIDLGYLSKEDRLPDNYLPRDFSEREFLPLKHAALGKEVSVKKAKKQGCCTIL
jgi:hypothetical protein